MTRRRHDVDLKFGRQFRSPPPPDGLFNADRRRFFDEIQTLSAANEGTSGASLRGSVWTHAKSPVFCQQGDFIRGMGLSCVHSFPEEPNQ